MIDIHFHCLPGIDDGPASWAEAVGLCRAALASGVSTIVATPHVLRDPWLNEDPTARQQLIDELNRLLGGRPQVVPGCEFYYSSDAVELWQQGEAGPLVGLNRTHYLLLEFPASRVSDRAEQMIHELVIAGVRPVIAHPERNVVLARKPERLERLVQLGAYTQITAASILGLLGDDIEKACDRFFRLGLIDFVASDAHSLERRPPALGDARQHVRQKWGAEAETVLFEENPKKLFADAPLRGV